MRSYLETCFSYTLLSGGLIANECICIAFTGLYDMEAPCTDVEKHMLSKLLDRENTGDIDFTQFSKGLKYIRYCILPYKYTCS